MVICEVLSTVIFSTSEFCSDDSLAIESAKFGKSKGSNVSYSGFECRCSVDQTESRKYLEIRLLRNNHISYICTHVGEDYSKCNINCRH